MTINEQKPRLSDQDLAVLRAMFLDREGAIDVIRKIFFPELTADSPIKLNNDLWTTGFDLSGMTPEQKVIAVEARQMMVNQIEGGLQVIRLMVGTKEETVEQAVARVRKDSSK